MCSVYLYFKKIYKIFAVNAKLHTVTGQRKLCCSTWFVVNVLHFLLNKEFDSPYVYQILYSLLCEKSVISFCCLKAQMSPERTGEFSRDNLGGKVSSTEICLLIFTNTVCLQLITVSNRKGLTKGSA